MSEFVVHGPFAVDFENSKGGRRLIFDDFWADGSDAAYLCGERGCYVFAIRNRGLTPIYVGKAAKSFKQETFNSANKHKYHNGFIKYAKGTPLIFFIVHPTRAGKTNEKQIGEVEDFLIQAGFAKNPNIQNVKGRGVPKWRIKGVVRGSSGKHSRAEIDFAKLFDIHRS
jgi:hypothetical protein